MDNRSLRSDDPEVWASILGWHLWRDVAGTWHARQAGASTAAVLQAASLDVLRTLIDRPDRQQNPRPQRGAGQQQ
jgi:hypothetical protein